MPYPCTRAVTTMGRPPAARLWVNGEQIDCSPFYILLAPLLQPGGELPECPTSVCNAQLLLLRSFGQRTIVGRVIEDRVISKPALAPWAVGNQTLDDPCSFVHQGPSVDHSDGTDKPAGPRTGM